MANGADGFALRAEVLQYSSQGPTAGKICQGARTAGNQEGMVPGTIYGLKLSAAAEVVGVALGASSPAGQPLDLPGPQ